MVAGVRGQFPSVKRAGSPPEFKKGKNKNGEDQWDTRMISQMFHVNSLFDQKLTGKKGAARVLEKSLFDAYLDSEKFVKKCREAVEDHFDRRFQLFFTQLISVYKTPYHFEWIEANDQFGRGGTYDLKCGNKEDTLKTQAAHSSTLPCLIAHSRETWDAGDRSQGFVYIKHGNSYSQHNATVELPIWVNQSDTFLDGTHNDERLRSAAIRIVNQVAKGLRTPTQGMKDFVEAVQASSDACLAELADGSLKKPILQVYRERAEEIEVEMEEGDSYFDHLLGVQVGHEKEDLLRDIVFKKRFSLIQACESLESQIARDVLDAQNKMLKKTSRSLKNVDHRLRYVLLDEVNPQFRKMLERLFCTSLAQLSGNLQLHAGRLRTFEGKERIRTFREKHKKAVDDLKRTLRRRFREMSGEELNYRAQLFKDLRVRLGNWNQKEFVTAFHEKYPVEPMSQAMVSRMEQRTRIANRDYVTPLEQRRKDIGEEKSKKIAHTFGIDAGLFLPAVVSSMY